MLMMIFFFLGIVLLLQIGKLLEDSGDRRRIGKIDTRYCLTVIQHVN